MEFYTVADINLAEQLDYDCAPEDAKEWAWIEEHASLTHKDNGNDGIWDFMVSTSIYENEPSKIPTTLFVMFKEAFDNKAQYIFFNQGC